MSSSALAAGLHYLRGKLAAHQRDDESDERLLHAFTSRGDGSAFAALVRRHGPMVLNVCRRVLGHEQDAEDAFQAVFLVLSRNAAALRTKSLLASFLHGIAHRISMKAKQTAARRRKYEGSLGALTRPRSPVNPADELSWREVRTLLDEEIAGLPEIYRVVFVLFYLEDLSREETARRLGLKEAAVAKRLAVARKRLQDRLAQRGLELTAVLAASAVATPIVSALPVVPLPSATVAKASPTVAALAESISPFVGFSKSKIAAAILLATTLVGGAGAWFFEARGDKATGERRGVSPPVQSPTGGLTPRRSPDMREIQGRVLDSDGKPKAGAKLLLLDEDKKIKELGITAADGRFTVAVPKEPAYKRLFRYLVAQAKGAGIDFLDLRSLKADKPVELRLVKDNVVRGRIVNTEGKPVAGVRVAAETINAHIDNTLDTFLAAFLKVLAGGKGHAEQKSLWYEAETLFTATTDVDGRFTLHGIGSERTIRLRLSGGGIADVVLFNVVNRAGFDSKPYNKEFRDYYTRANGSKDQRWIPSHLLYGPDFSLVAEPEKVIRGRVLDTDTGKGQAHLKVRLSGYWDDTSMQVTQSATTDAEGRYEIHGGRKATRYLVQFLGDAIAGYPPSQIWADDTPGYQPVPADLKVKKGVIVTGKVIDRATGKVIPGWAEAAVLYDNPFVKDHHYDEFWTTSGMPVVARSLEIDAEGTFQLVTIPGPVLLMGGPNHQKMEPLDALKFRGPVPDPKYPEYFQAGSGPVQDDMRLTYRGLRGFRGGVDGNFCKVLNVKPGVARIEQDIILERDNTNTIVVQVQDADGRPLSGAWVTGISPRTRYRAIRLEGRHCPVYQLEPGKSRLVVLCEPSRKLAAVRTFNGEEKEPIVVKLSAMGTLKGRLLDADGKPLAGLEVDLHYSDDQAESIHSAIHEGKQIVSNANGVFAFDELLPHLKFTLMFRRGSRLFQRVAKDGDATMQVKAGKCRDLGAIKVRPGRERVEE